MPDSGNNSIDFEKLMQELTELEKAYPGKEEILEMKEKVQKELDRRKSQSPEGKSQVSESDPSVIPNASEILDSIYTKAKEKQHAASHTRHSGHHHSSHSHRRSSRNSHHRHHTVVAPSSELASVDMSFEDLVYQENVPPANSNAPEQSPKRILSHGDHSTSEPVSPAALSSKEGSQTAPKHLQGSNVSTPSGERKKYVVASSNLSKTKNHGWKALKRWQRVTSVVLGVILLFVLAGTCSFQYLMNRIHRINPDEIPELSKEGLEDLLSLSREELEKLRETDPDAESLIIDKKDRYGVGNVKITPMQRDDVLNILLIGQDRRKGDKGQMRSDSMILVTIDKSSKEMKLTSLMRDMYVPVPGYGYGMINATLLNGGMKLLNATIEQDLGVHIDGDIQIDFYRFIKLMDLVGPLDIELNEEEVKYFNENHGWNLTKGVNSLNSEQILAYCRVRKVGRSDWERTDRQRRVIQTVYSKLKKSDIPTLIQFAYNAMPLITTNIDKNSELIGIVYTILSNHMPITKSSRIPLEGTYTQQVKDGVLHVLVPELYPNAKALQTTAFGYSNIK